jgi:hypothetical protein
MARLSAPHSAPVASIRRLVGRIAKASILIAGVALLAGFETSTRIDEDIIKPLPRHFRLQVVQGTLAPTEAQFRRSGNTYVNEAPTATGGSLLSASWFAVHPTDSDAVLFEYPSTDTQGNTIYRLEYAIEVDRNRYALYRLDEARFIAALNGLESAVRRGDASWGDRKAYEDLTAIWNAHASRAGVVSGQPFHVAGLDDVNTLIAYSRRLDEGQKIILSTGDVIEVYIR